MQEDIYDRFVSHAIAHGYVPGGRTGRIPAGRLAILNALDDVLDERNFLFSSMIYDKMKKTFNHSARHMQFVGLLIVPRRDFIGLFFKRGINVVALDEFLNKYVLQGAEVDKVRLVRHKPLNAQHKEYVIYKQPRSAAEYLRERVTVQRVAELKVAQVNLEI
ncbi:MAG TPA: hypothetical protein HA224_04360 [Nanoarchaeota archaeon]|nr:hypothetical protein [Nanoarchaeota archaeon]